MTKVVLEHGDIPVIDRRQAMLLGVAAAATAIFPAQAAVPERFIDVHHHFAPPGGVSSNPWSAESTLDEMDRNDVATGIGFLGSIDTPDLEKDKYTARSWNEFGARLRHDRPQRFGIFAALPMNSIEGSLGEMAHAFDVLKADGLGLATNYGDRWLGDAYFDPVWEEANRRKAVIFIHPKDAPCCGPDQLSYMTPLISGPWIEWPVNTARTIFSLMVSGTLRKYRDIRFIFSHGGGVMPLLINRISGLTDWRAVGPKRFSELFPEGIHAEFARLYFECAQAYSEVNLGALTKLVPTTQLLFGTDYDRFPIQHSVKNFRELSLEPVARTRIARNNAEALFPRLKR